MGVVQERLSAQHSVPRREIVMPITRSSEGEGRSFNPGDALDISLSEGTGPTLVVFTHRRHGVVWGYLAPGYALDDIETWSAKVASDEAVRLKPFTIRDCGCVVNFGGYVVRTCDTDALKASETCDKHDRVACPWCALDIEREARLAEKLGLEDRAYIEEAQS